ncbi:MAG: hypothetical protein JW819_09215 [Candidatus Krumholzibacteriota bacterium]|jgi:hypothetical protein|nr:hypothetical protein [Candidatus Krumholzibacteriota bacterium]
MDDDRRDDPPPETPPDRHDAPPVERAAPPDRPGAPPAGRAAPPPRRARPAAGLARPLAFTLLALYGLLSFLTGYQDFQRLKRLPESVSVALILFGVLLGTAAVRVLMRRHKAFTLAAVGLLALLILDVFTDLVPGAVEDWRHPLLRALLSAFILWLVLRADRALAPRRRSPPL